MEIESQEAFATKVGAGKAVLIGRFRMVRAGFGKSSEQTDMAHVGFRRRFDVIHALSTLIHAAIAPPKQLGISFQPRTA